MDRQPGLQPLDSGRQVGPEEILGLVCRDREGPYVRQVAIRRQFKVGVFRL
jgi:hypothetical protein